MLRAYQVGRDDVARLMDPERGTVRLDFMHSLGTWLVPDLLKSYRAQHPHVDIRLHQGAAQELVSRVENGESDLALVGPRPDAALGWHQIKVQRLGLAVPEGHWAANRREVKLAEFAAEPFIGMLPGYGTRMLLDALADDAGFSPHLVFESMELTTVAGLVAAGLGVALLPLDDPYLQVGSLIPPHAASVPRARFGVARRGRCAPSAAIPGIYPGIEKAAPGGAAEVTKRSYLVAAAKRSATSSQLKTFHTALT